MAQHPGVHADHQKKINAASVMPMAIARAKSAHRGVFVSVL